MPAIQRGQAYKLGVGKWGLRYYDENGVRRRKSAFPSKSSALAHYRDFIEPRLLGEPEPPEPEPERTFGEFVPVYRDRHAATVRPRTVETLRKRLGHRRKLEDGETCRCATCAFGDVPLRDLERMSGEIASWQAKLPKRSRYGTMQAFRQTLGAAVRWGYMACNPAKLAGRNPQPPPRPTRVYTQDELEAIAAELPARYRPLPAFAAASGLRPEEWAVLERRDVDRRGAALRVRRTISAGEIVELAKTSRSRREVPLSDRALAALEELSPRLDSPYLFAARRSGPFDLANFRRREWAPAIETSGVARPARLYDLRSTFASNSLAAGVTVFELARLMGTSVAMIERHYGTLLEGAGADIARRLSAFEAEQGRARDRATDADP
jgi:integrase